MTNGAGSDAAAAFLPPLLTCLRVETKNTPVPYDGYWQRGEPLLVSHRTLASLAPSLVTLMVSRASTVVESDSDSDEDDDPRAPRMGTWKSKIKISPMARLAPSGLTQLTRLTSLDIEADYAFETSDLVNRRAWVLASRALVRPLAARLRRLVLGEANRGYDGDPRTPDLPFSLSLLTALSSLEMDATDFLSAGPLRRMTQLRRLVVQSDPYDTEIHAPVLARDLAPLNALELLSLSQTERCYAPVIANNLPGLRILVLGDFSRRPVATAVLGRMRRGGIDVFQGFPMITRRLSVADLEGMIEKMAEEPDGDIQAHDERHQALLDRVAVMEAADAAASAAEE
jgi:hypothetical protein